MDVGNYKRGDIVTTRPKYGKIRTELIVAYNGIGYNSILLTTEPFLKINECLKTEFSLYGNVNRYANVFRGTGFLKPEHIIEKVGSLDEVTYRRICSALFEFLLGHYHLEGNTYVLELQSYSIMDLISCNSFVPQQIESLPIEAKSDMSPKKETAKDYQAEISDDDASIGDSDNIDHNDNRDVLVVSRGSKISDILSKEDIQKLKENWKDSNSRSDTDIHNSTVLLRRELEERTAREAKLMEEEEQQEESEKKVKLTGDKPELKPTKVKKVIQKNEVVHLSEEEQAEFDEKYKAFLKSQTPSDRINAIFDIYQTDIVILSEVYANIVLHRDLRPQMKSFRASKEDMEFIANNPLSTIKDRFGISYPIATKYKSWVDHLVNGTVPEEKSRISRRDENDKLANQIIDQYTDPNNTLTIRELALKFNKSDAYISAVLRNKKLPIGRANDVISIQLKADRMINNLKGDYKDLHEAILREFRDYSEKELLLLAKGKWKKVEYKDMTEEIIWRTNAAKLIALKWFFVAFDPDNSHDMDILRFISNHSVKEVGNLFAIDKLAAHERLIYARLFIYPRDHFKKCLEKFSLEYLISHNIEPFSDLPKIAHRDYIKSMLIARYDGIDEKFIDELKAFMRTNSEK